MCLLPRLAGPQRKMTEAALKLSCNSACGTTPHHHTDAEEAGDQHEPCRGLGHGGRVDRIHDRRSFGNNARRRRGENRNRRERRNQNRCLRERDRCGDRRRQKAGFRSRFWLGREGTGCRWHRRGNLACETAGVAQRNGEKRCAGSDRIRLDKARQRLGRRNLCWKDIAGVSENEAQHKRGAQQPCREKPSPPRKLCGRTDCFAHLLRPV